MDTSITVISAIIIAIVSSFVTNWFTRKTRLEAEWRIDKLKHYEQFVDSITEVFSNPKNFNKVHKRFARAYNSALLIAPQEVTDILNKFYRVHQDTFGKEMTKEEENKLVSDQKHRLKQLVLAIRKDMKITPKDDPATFQFILRSPTLDETFEE